MNKSKRPNTSSLENNVDFISDMPDSILELILQGLPNTEEVVRTSVLSSRWRHLWTSIPLFPSLGIDCDRIPNPFPEKFVTWALANKPTVDLDTFRLCCAHYFTLSNVHMWIKAAVKRNVKSLDLKLNPKSKPAVRRNGMILKKIHLPDWLIECQSLESLRLFLYECILSLPRGSGFARLKVLELNKVYCFHEDAVEELLEKCPLLEDLSLIDCFIRKDNYSFISISSSKLKTLIIRNWKNVFNGKKKDFWSGLMVSCPILVKFEYVGRICELILEDVHSLKKAVIHPEDLTQDDISPALGTCISKWLAGISHVDSLSLNLYFLQCMGVAHDDLIRDFSVFLPNLKKLETTTTIDAFTLKVMIEIIKHSPVLESLHLIIQKESLTREYWELDKVEIREITTRHLKRVEFLEFDGEEHKLVIARWLLEHANALEELVFSWSNEGKYHEKSTETLNQVSKVHKASSTVKLITLLKH